MQDARTTLANPARHDEGHGEEAHDSYSERSSYSKGGDSYHAYGGKKLVCAPGYGLPELLVSSSGLTRRLQADPSSNDNTVATQRYAPSYDEADYPEEEPHGHKTRCKRCPTGTFSPGERWAGAAGGAMAEGS